MQGDQSRTGGSSDGPTDEAPSDAQATPSTGKSAALLGSDTDPVADLPDGDDVPTDLRVTFWTLVFVLKFAIIATTLGLLFAWFEGRLQLGASLVGLGAVLFAFAVVRYRRYRRSRDEEDDAEADPPVGDQNG